MKEVLLFFLPPLFVSVFCIFDSGLFIIVVTFFLIGCSVAVWAQRTARGLFHDGYLHLCSFTETMAVTSTELHGGGPRPAVVIVHSQAVQRRTRTKTQGGGLESQGFETLSRGSTNSAFVLPQMN